MNYVINVLFRIYKKLDNVTIVSTIAFYLNDKMKGIWNSHSRSFRYNKSISNSIIPYSLKKSIPKKVNTTKIAFICDDMTYMNFENECEAVYLTPQNWYELLEEFKPDLFFCESAWSGLSQYRQCWRGKIYKNNKVRYENRRDLLNILDYCKKKQIETVFWNKEDPTFFENSKYNFVDTALKFDYIFTTAKECVNKYKHLGHENVFPLMFGFLPTIYNPLNSGIKQKVAVFAGSWYKHDIKRSYEMDEIFEKILNENIELHIYDRNYKATSINTFPPKYSEFIKGKASYHELGDIYKDAQYIVNINTVTDSETMFARRVFESMACGTCIISNDSLGMRKIFGNNVLFLEDEFNKETIKEKCYNNMMNVFQNHTNSIRLEQIIRNIGKQYIAINKKVTIVFTKPNFNMKEYNKIVLPDKEVYVLEGHKLYNPVSEEQFTIEEAINLNSEGYCTIVGTDIPSGIDYSILVNHFAYLNNRTGIIINNREYRIVKNTQNFNVLFRIEMLQRLIRDFNLELEKLYL